MFQFYIAKPNEATNILIDGIYPHSETLLWFEHEYNLTPQELESILSSAPELRSVEWHMGLHDTVIEKQHLIHRLETDMFYMSKVRTFYIYCNWIYAESYNRIFNHGGGLGKQIIFALIPSDADLKWSQLTYGLLWKFMISRMLYTQNLIYADPIWLMYIQIMTKEIEGIAFLPFKRIEGTGDAFFLFGKTEYISQIAQQFKAIEIEWTPNLAQKFYS